MGGSSLRKTGASLELQGAVLVTTWRDARAMGWIAGWGCEWCVGSVYEGPALGTQCGPISLLLRRQGK